MKYIGLNLSQIKVQFIMKLDPD